ncbi:MAG: hypothetical protein GY754_28695 [bacterium]|nr:hypothetical protein [bacterium]
MGNLKYHTLNIIAVIIFSYVTAIAINETIAQGLAPESRERKKTSVRREKKEEKKELEFYTKTICESGFFGNCGTMPPNPDDGPGPPPRDFTPIENLALMGTISGPSSFARAMIKKKNEKAARTFALRRISKELNNNVYGSKLIRIYDSKVVLLNNGEKYTLKLYGDTTGKKPANGTAAMGGGSSTSISRAQILQQGKNLTRGIRIGPNRVNGKTDGYKLHRVKSSNMFYKMGARSGDIVKRINGQKIDGMETLMRLYSTLKEEPRLSIDIDRGGTPVSYSINITD